MNPVPDERRAGADALPTCPPSAPSQRILAQTPRAGAHRAGSGPLGPRPATARRPPRRRPSKRLVAGVAVARRPRRGGRRVGHRRDRPTTPPGWPASPPPTSRPIRRRLAAGLGDPVAACAGGLADGAVPGRGGARATPGGLCAGRAAIVGVFPGDPCGVRPAWAFPDLPRTVATGTLGVVQLVDSLTADAGRSRTASTSASPPISSVSELDQLGLVGWTLIAPATDRAGAAVRVDRLRPTGEDRHAGAGAGADGD